MLPVSGGILDAGAGPGFKAVRLFQDELSEGRLRIVTGLDFSPRMVQEANSRYGQIDPDLRFMQGQLDHLPDSIEPGSQAGIWDDGAFHHLPPITAARTLESHYEALAPGGALFLLVKKGPEKGVHPHKETNLELNLTRMFYRYDEQSLRELVASHGFIIQECRTQERPAALAARGQTDDEWIYLFASKPKARSAFLRNYVLRQTLWRLLDGLLYLVRSPRLHVRMFSFVFPILLMLSPGEPRPLFHVYSDEAANFYTQWYWEQSEMIAKRKTGKDWGQMSLPERWSVAFDMFLAFDRIESMSQNPPHIAERQMGPFEVGLNLARKSPTRPIAGDVVALEKEQQSAEQRAREQKTRVISYIMKLFPGVLPPMGLQKLGGTWKYIVLSKFPVAWNHVMLVSKTFQPNYFTLKDADAALDFLARSKNPNRTVDFNSWGAGGSVNFKHQPVYDTHKDPLPDGSRYGAPIEKFCGAPDATSGGTVKVAREKEGWPGRPIFLWSADRRDLATVAMRLIDQLQAKNFAPNVGFYKEIKDGQEIFRALIRPHGLNRELVPDAGFTAFGMLELNGHMELQTADTYAHLQPEKVAEFMDFISLSAPERDEALRQLEEEFRPEHAMETLRREQERAASFFEDVYATIYPGDIMKGDAIQLNPHGKIPNRLRSLYRADPIYVRSLFNRIRAGQPLTVHPPRTGEGIDWQRNAEVSRAIDILQRRLEENMIRRGPWTLWNRGAIPDSGSKARAVALLRQRLAA